MATLRISIESGDAVRGANAAKDALRGLGAQALQAENELRRISDVDLELGNLRLEGSDPLGVRTAIAGADQALAEFELRRQVAFGAGINQTPFGAGLGGSGIEGALTSTELGLGRVSAAEASATEAAVLLGTSLERIGTVGPVSFERSAVSAHELEAATRGALAAQEQLLGLGGLQGQIPPAAPQAISGATQLVGPTTIDARGADLIAAQERAYIGARAAAASYGTTVQRSVSGATSALDLNLATIARVGGAILGVRGITAGIDSLISYERGLVAVGQATNTAGDELEELSRRIVNVSTSGLPVATQDLLQFAEAAGRLQIRSPEGIEQFVRDMALLRTVAPDLGGAADQAGDAVGRFLKLSGESPANVGQLADVVARLDDEFGASGATIFDTGEQIAKASQDSIRSSADVLGLGAAFVQLGVDGTAGGTAVAQVMTVVRDAVQRGGQEIRTLAEVTGLSAEQIRQSFRTDAASLFITVLEGLGRQGDNSAQAMDDLGLASARQARSLGPLIANTSELRRGMQLARDAQIEGGDAARDAAQAQDTLGAKLASTRNLFTAAVGANGALVSSLGAVVDVGNAVAANLLGVEQGAVGVGEGAQIAADGLTAAAVAGAGALIVSRLAAGYRLLSAELLVAKTATDLYTGATVTSTVATNGLAAASARALPALAAFAVSPLGIALAAGAAVAGIVALSRALDDVDGDQAAEEIDKVIDRMAGLDRAAVGLRDARDIIFKADLTGDADAKAQGLQARLRELEGAATVIAGEVRLNVEDVEPQFREVFRGLEGGLGGQALEQRMNAALAASVAALEIPRVPPERAAELRESLNEAFAGVPPETVERLRRSVGDAVAAAQIPAGKLEALKVDELFPDIEGAGLNFASAVEDAVREARERAQRVSAESTRTLALGAAGTFQVPTIDVEQAFPASLGQALEDKVGDLFGADLGARAKGALENALSGAVEGVDAEALKIDLASLSTGEIDDEGIERLSENLEKAGASGIGAAAALRAVDAAIEQTRAQIEAVEFTEPSPRPSDFYLDEARRIRAATDDAELSIGRLSKSDFSQEIGTTTQLTGLDARREALVRERAEYEETLRSRVTAQEEGDRISEEEAASLSALAGNYFEARDAALLFTEAQRRLGAEQELLGAKSDLLGRQLQLLALNAQGDTTRAFEIMREQIELARQAAEKDLDIKIETGAIKPDEIEATERMIEATHRLSLAELERRKFLVENQGAIERLASASESFASNTFDALVGLQDPLEALKSFVLDLARSFVEPELKAGFLNIFGGDLREEAAERVGVKDKITPEGAVELEDVSDVGLKETGAAKAFAELSAASSAAGTGLERAGVAGNAAAGGAEHLATAAELAAASLERLAGRDGLQAVEDAGTSLADRLDLPASSAREGLQAGSGLDLPGDVLEPGRASFEEALAGLPAIGRPRGEVEGGLELGAGQRALVGLDALDDGATEAARATAAAAQSMGVAAASSELAATGLGTTGISAELAAVGLTTAQAAALGVTSSFFAATQAAAAYAAQVGFEVATSLLPGGAPVGSSYGDAFGVGAPRMLAAGDVVGKMSDLEGQVVSSPRFVIGEGADPEAVMPLDSGGGVRGIGARGERVSLELARDPSGKLGVRVPSVDADDVQRFAAGGVPGFQDRRSRSGQNDILQRNSAAQSLSITVEQPASTTNNNSTTDNSKQSMQFVSHYHFHGNGSSPDAGFKRARRHHEQDMRDRSRNLFKGRGR